jgi:hypothetical protein
MLKMQKKQNAKIEPQRDLFGFTVPEKQNRSVIGWRASWTTRYGRHIECLFQSRGQAERIARENGGTVTEVFEE